MSDINDMVKKKLAATGVISSSDVANFGSTQPDTANTALSDDTSAALSRTPDSTVTAARKNVLGKGTGTAVITKEDKRVFLTALVGNARYTREYNLAGGAITLTLRSKTIDETNAIIATFSKEIRSGRHTTSVEQTNRLRSMLMVFGIATLNGVAYALPEAPLLTTVTDGGTEEPTWLPRADAWQGISDAMHTILWQAIADFEDRYWTMVESANNSDFWQPEASI